MSKYWKYFLPGYLLALPHTIVGILICWLAYKAHSWEWNDGCLECIAGTDVDGTTRIWGKPSAQAHGFLIVSASTAVRKDPRIRIHERCHVFQSFIGGPLYAAMYGIFFLYKYAKQGLKDWYSAYRSNPFERHAYANERPEEGKWGYEVS